MLIPRCPDHRHCEAVPPRGSSAPLREDDGVCLRWHDYRENNFPGRKSYWYSQESSFFGMFGVALQKLYHLLLFGACYRGQKTACDEQGINTLWGDFAGLVDLSFWRCWPAVDTLEHSWMHCAIYCSQSCINIHERIVCPFYAYIANALLTKTFFYYLV